MPPCSVPHGSSALKKIVILYIDGGGGHRAAARALEEAIRLQHRPWRVELVNADEILEPADPAFWFLGVRNNDIYNWLLGRGWMVGTKYLLPIVHCIIRVLYPAHVFLLRRCWQTRKPDLVVSVIPHLNRAFHESLQRENPNIPLVTLLTDLADYPPHFWIERQPQHFICGTDAAAQQAEQIARLAERVWRVSGLIIHPKFYQPACIDRGEERRKLGLDPELPTALVLFGGYGSRSMVKIAEWFRGSATGLQLIFLCGRNATLVRKLQSLRLPYRIHIQEFTEDVAHFMRLSDFLIGKPGPGSISEALAMQLPVIVNNDWKTMVHERFNARWIEEQGVGKAVARIRDLPAAVEHILKPDVYRAMRRRIEALNNRAVFEIPDVLENLLDKRESSIATQRDERPAPENVRTG